MVSINNEREPAQRLASLVGEQGVVPDALVNKYAAALAEVFLTNGYGVACAADPIYRDLIERLDSGQAGLMLRTFTMAHVATKLQYPLPRQQWETLLTLIEPKLTSRSDRDLLAAIRAYSGSPHTLRLDSEIQHRLGSRRAGRPRRAA